MTDSSSLQFVFSTQGWKRDGSDSYGADMLHGGMVHVMVRLFPDDEAALAAVRCPTLIVQGDRDQLGPLPVLQRIAAKNPLIDIVVIADAGHNLSAAQEKEAAEHAARWLAARFSA